MRAQLARKALDGISIDVDEAGWHAGWHQGTKPREGRRICLVLRLGNTISGRWGTAFRPSTGRVGYERPVRCPDQPQSPVPGRMPTVDRSEEHTSELQSLMRI